MSKVGGPKVLRIGHEGRQVLLDGIIVKRLESGRIVEIITQRVGNICMLTKNIQLQRLGPPVLVSSSTASGVDVVDGALSGVAHFCDSRQYNKGGKVEFKLCCFRSRNRNWETLTKKEQRGREKEYKKKQKNPERERYVTATRHPIMRRALERGCRQPRV
jgi:hypothetical protein